MREAPRRTEELAGILRSNAWFSAVLEAVQAAEPPEFWIGAGAVRDLVWDTRFGHGFDAADVKDVDVVYFDDKRSTDGELQERLRATMPDVPWEVTNQARVHEWYEAQFGVAVQPLWSVEDGISTWPETATSVAVRWSGAESLDVIAPYGLDDLLDGVWRRNPTRVTIEEAAARLERKDVGRRWPAVRVLTVG